MSSASLYLRAAEDLLGNAAQWEAYNSEGHCVVLAGPGSGKTKTLTIKLARMLAEDVEEPRGLACITYNNECARELENRLDALGIEPSERVFIGTVHSFSLTQIVLPYANTAKIDLPDGFRVANQQERSVALERAFRRTVGGPDNPRDWDFRMGRYRRSILDRNTEQWRTQDPELAQLVEAFEQELRRAGLIDFDDMPLLAVRALAQHEWLQRAILAKYPILAVDEYQDLGRALHRMVMGLCFSTGMRLFAVGDADQSIYGFTGAYPELLQRVADRPDVETVRLRFNYRSGTRIVAASEYALGEARGYRAPDDAAQGTIYFHPLPGNYDHQAAIVFDQILPDILEEYPGISLGDIAILYPAAWLGDSVSAAAQDRNIGVIRADTNALYPRSSRLLRWLEQCAVWCCGGWQSGDPRFSRLSNEGRRLFAEALTSDQKRLEFQRDLIAVLWARRDPLLRLAIWLNDLRTKLIDDLAGNSRTLSDEISILEAFIATTSDGGDAVSMTLGQFAGNGAENDRINLSTLHSAKGREFRVVILFAMDNGRIPRQNATPTEVREARRLFYVGFTRPKQELHIVYSSARPCPFVREVEERIRADEEQG